jgi:hypothetical protein
MIIYLLDNSNFDLSGGQTWAEVTEDDGTFLVARRVLSGGSAR